MNEILKKRIEDFASEYAERMYKNSTDCERKAAEHDMIKGAEFILCRQWISIDEALPEDNQYVVAMLHDKTIFVGMCIMWEGEALWYFETPYGLYSDIELYSGEVIAWMPIPELEEYRGEYSKR